MVNINTNNLSQNLFKEAVSRAKDGKIDSNDLNALIRIANENNVTKDEKSLLTGLLDQANVDKLKTSTNNNKPVTIEFVEPSKNAEKTMEIDIALVQKGGGADALAKLNSMSPALQAKFSYVLNSVDNKDELISVLAKGKLTVLDSGSKRTIESIADMIKGPNKTGVNGKKLAEETISILNNRDLITQGQHGTCGAGALQNYLWSKDSGEMVRIVKDLGNTGECTLRDKSVLKAGTGSLNWHAGDKMTGGDLEDRSDFNIIFQSSVMRSVALVGGNRDTITDKIYDYADYNVNNDNGDASSVRHGDSAADPLLLSSLAEGITKTDFSIPLWNTFDKLKTAANQGRQPIALFSADRYVDLHYVVVQKVDADNVYYQNTATGRLDGMSVSEFKGRLRSAIIPD